MCPFPSVFDGKVAWPFLLAITPLPRPQYLTTSFSFLLNSYKEWARVSLMLFHLSGALPKIQAWLTVLRTPLLLFDSQSLLSCGRTCPENWQKHSCWQSSRGFIECQRQSMADPLPGPPPFFPSGGGCITRWNCLGSSCWILNSSSTDLVPSTLLQHPPYSWCIGTQLSLNKKLLGKWTCQMFT